jgi:hypothetical protein
MHLAGRKSSTPPCSGDRRPKATTKYADEAEAAHRKIVKMVVERGHPMVGRTDTLLALMGPLESAGGVGKAWIRNSNALKKAVGRVTQELSTSTGTS